MSLAGLRIIRMRVEAEREISAIMEGQRSMPCIGFSLQSMPRDAATRHSAADMENRKDVGELCCPKSISTDVPPPLRLFVVLLSSCLRCFRCFVKFPRAETFCSCFCFLLLLLLLLGFSLRVALSLSLPLSLLVFTFFSSSGKQTNTKTETERTLDLIGRLTKPCPACHTPVEKLGGCNQMVCYHCDTSFCW